MSSSLLVFERIDESVILGSSSQRRAEPSRNCSGNNVLSFMNFFILQSSPVRMLARFQNLSYTTRVQNIVDKNLKFTLNEIAKDDGIALSTDQ